MYCSLLHIDASTNTQRAYYCSLHQEGVEWNIIAGWGRYMSTYRTRTYSYKNLYEALNRLNSILKRRKSHGYELWGASADFPAVYINDFLPCSTPNIQYSLF